MNRSITDLVRGMRDYRTAFVPLGLFAIAAAGFGLFLSIADELGEVELAALDERIFLWFHTPAGVPIGPEWLQRTASDITAPLDGGITELNTAIVENPALVNEDPLEDGWFFKMTLSDQSELEALMDEAAYASFVKGLE